MLETDDGLREAQDKARADAESVAVAAAMVAATAAAAAAATTGGSSAAMTAIPGMTVLQLFERSGHWRLADAARLLGLREADAKPLMKDFADYVRAGKFAKHWICKVEFRTPAMPVPDESALANRLTGGA